MDVKPINLTPAELRAVEEHKYFLSQKRGTEVSIEEAIDDFLKNFAKDWAREKLRRDNLEQRNEIEKHKYFKSLEQGRDIGRATAAEEWCQKYAPIWRAERESLERNGFSRISFVVKNPHELHMRPVSGIARVATDFDCDIYVHKKNMPYYNFMLNGRAYMNVKSILGFLSMGVELGDTLEFIATGSQAKEALHSIERLLEDASASE